MDGCVPIVLNKETMGGTQYIQAASARRSAHGEELRCSELEMAGMENGMMDGGYGCQDHVYLTHDSSRHSVHSNETSTLHEEVASAGLL